MNISLEIGFRFLPPDEEIISFFLLNKMNGHDDRTRHIREVDLLKQEPWELPALSIVQSRYPEWLFFYKLNKISEVKNERLTVAGYWKSTGTDRLIKDRGRVIGTKKTLVFYKGRTPHGVKTDWVMHEYRATAELIPPIAENSYVVGILREKAAENPENSISYDGQPSREFAASTSQNNAAGVTSREVAPQPQSYSMDYKIALQTLMEAEGIFDSDLPPLNGLLDLPSSSAITSNNQNKMEEEGFTLEDILPSNDLVDDEQNDGRVHLGTINSVSFSGQPSRQFAAFTSQNNAAEVTSMEVAPQPESYSMDYEIALQTQMEDQGIFDYDLSPLNSLLDLPPSIAVTSYDQNNMEEEGFTLEDLPPSNDLVDDEQNDWQVHFGTIEQEKDFMTRMFPNQEEYPHCSDYRTSDYVEHDHILMSDGTGPGHSERFNLKRMENGFHQDEILIMGSSCCSTTVTYNEINSLEVVREEKSVDSRTCKSQYEPRSHTSVMQGQHETFHVQGKSSGEAISRDKAKQSGVRGPVVELVQNKISLFQSNQHPKMDQNWNRISGLKSRANDSSGSGRKNSFNFLEVSQLSCKQNQQLAYVGKVLLGVVMIIFTAMLLIFTHS